MKVPDEVSWGSTAGPPRVFNHGSEELLPTSLTPGRFLVRDASLVASGQLPDGIAHLADGAGDFALTSKGQLFLDGKPHGPLPRGFTPRRRTSLGSDGHGRLLVVAGDDFRLPQRLTDAWSFDGAWHKLTPLGDPPALLEASVAFDPRRQAWLVVGGQGKDHRWTSQMSELSGNRWTTLTSRFSDEKKATTIDAFHHVELLAVDEASGQVLLVRPGSRPKKKRLYTYGGSGQWTLLDTLALPGWSSAFAWDAARRTLVAVGETTVSEFPLARLLDALPAHDAPASEAAAKPATRAKPAASAKGTRASAKVAADVWLRRRKGKDDRFWFASVEGDGWVERSGKRGEAPSLKRHPRVDTLAAAVAKKLAAGYEHAPERAGAAVLAGRAAFRFWFSLTRKEVKFRGSYGHWLSRTQITLNRTPGASDLPPGCIASEDRIGGLPLHVSADAWPRCPGCQKPMTHLLSLHAHEERLPLTDHVALSVFLCTSGKCHDVSRVVLSPRATPGATKAVAKALTAYPAVYERVFEPDPSPDESPDADPTAKVGGYPSWHEVDETPDCPRCQKPMRFVAQFDHLHGALPCIGNEDGTSNGLVFCCERHGEARLILQWLD